MKPIVEGRYLEPRQAADLSGLDVKQIARMFDSGALRGFRLPVGMRARRVDPASLRAFLAASGLPTVALDLALAAARGAAS